MEGQLQVGWLDRHDWLHRPHYITNVNNNKKKQTLYTNAFLWKHIHIHHPTTNSVSSCLRVKADVKADWWEVISHVLLKIMHSFMPFAENIVTDWHFPSLAVTNVPLHKVDNANKINISEYTMFLCKISYHFVCFVLLAGREDRQVQWHEFFVYFIAQYVSPWNMHQL